MRFPTSWADCLLLEDTPFVEEFIARKFGDYNISTRNQEAAWYKRIARNIHRNPELRKVAVRWAEYAFAPEGTPARDGETSRVTTSDCQNWRFTDTSDHSSLASIQIFVRFYWALYSADKVSAQAVVDVERKSRGFNFRLPAIAEEDTQQITLTDVVGLEQNTISPIAEVAPVSVDDELATTNRSTSECRPESDIRGVAESTAVPADGLETCTISLQLDVSHPDEDKEVVVFSEDGDIDAFLEAVSGAEPLLASHQDDTSTSQTFPVVTNGETHVMEPKSQRKKKSKPRANVPSEALRRGHPRNASHPERLACMAQAEIMYHNRAKRGLMDDLTDLLPTDVQCETTYHLSQARSNKKSKLGPAAAGRNDEAMGVSEEHVTGHSTEAGATLLPPASSVSVDAAVSAVNGTHVRSARSKTKKTISGKKVNVVEPNTPARPAKRPRVEGGETDDPGSCDILATLPAQSIALGQQAKVRAPHSSQKETSTSGSRRRNREQPGSVVDTQESAQITKAKRKVAKLHSQRVRLADMRSRAPKPPPASLGIPADLPEADRILQYAATEAVLDLNNTEQIQDIWVKDSELQDDSPADSSEDEDDDLTAREMRGFVQDEDSDEDIPLSRVVTSHRARVGYKVPPESNTSISSTSHSVEDEAHTADVGTCYAVSSRTIPSLPGSITSSVGTVPAAHSLSQTLTIIPNLIGTRVPRPIPLPSVPKLPLTMQPPIWAKSRQELCESLDCFRSYQAGVYYVKDMVKGYLLSQFSASRDIFARDGRLIISHGGGKAESLHSTKGQQALHAASDQLEGDKSVRALLRSYHMKRPIALIIDDKYALFPYDLTAKKDCTYVALGFYHIKHAWAELQLASDGKSVVRYKFAFEWCANQSSPPWWIKSDATPYNEASQDGVDYCTCVSCKRSSPLVYDNSWMCLHPNCSAFWTLSNGSRPPQDLTYAESFLHSSFECKHDMLDGLAPQPPVTEAVDGVITSRRFCKGWHCKKCGRLSCRFKWQHWECQNCKATLQVMGKSRSPKEFWSQMAADFLHHKIGDGSGINHTQLTFLRVGNLLGNYCQYVLPHNRGKIYLIMGSKLTNGMADEIFQEYQEQAKTGELQFRRWPLRSHQCRGELLTNYFSQNTGEPYQYVGGTANTVPFDRAPSAVVKARDLIQARMASVLQAEGEPHCYCFNEVLSAAYMEEQRMAFHSDAELGLGPRVASLSLGSSAYMHFRLHKKYRTDGGVGSTRNALTLFLRHGDVVVMDGAGVQEYYEHTVVPLNFRIAATARYIGGNRTHSH